MDYYKLGHEKVKISVRFTTSANGRILPPFIILPRKTPLPDYVPPNNVIVHYKPHSKTFDSDVISNGVIQRVLVMRENQKDALLIFDNAPCHRTSQVQQTLADNGIECEFIPARMTSLLQPQDVCFMRVISF